MTIEVLHNCLTSDIVGCLHRVINDKQSKMKMATENDDLFDQKSQIDNVRLIEYIFTPTYRPFSNYRQET